MVTTRLVVYTVMALARLLAQLPVVAQVLVLAFADVACAALQVFRRVSGFYSVPFCGISGAPLVYRRGCESVPQGHHSARLVCRVTQLVGTLSAFDLSKKAMPAGGRSLISE